MDGDGWRAFCGTVTMIMSKLGIRTVPNGSGRRVPIHNIYIIVKRQGTVIMIMSKLSIGTVRERSGRTVPIHDVYIIVQAAGS